MASRRLLPKPGQRPCQLIPSQRLMRKLKLTANALSSRSRRSTGSILLHLAVTHEIIYRLEKAQDIRPLSPDAPDFCKSLKQSYLGVASLERMIACQHSRANWLKDGDANTSFFHLHASFHRHKNRIFSLKRGDSLITDTGGMAAEAFAHFERLLGIELVRNFSLILAPVRTWRPIRRERNLAGS